MERENGSEAALGAFGPPGTIRAPVPRKSASATLQAATSEKGDVEPAQGDATTQHRDRSGEDRPLGLVAPS